MKKVLQLLVLSLFSLSVFVSCQNFLNGFTLKDQIEKQVEYAKLPFVKINLTVDESDAVNKITPIVNVYEDKYKTGDVIELSVEPKSAYKFIKWTAVPEECVSFKDAGALTTTAEIIKKPTDAAESVNQITIKPVLVEYLVVRSFEPQFETAGSSYDKAVVIAFNKKINPETVSLSSKTKSGSISIVSTNNNIQLEEYFDLSINLEGNKIVLTPKASIKNLFSSSENLFDITVILNSNNLNIFDADGLSLNGTIKNSYRINNTLADIPSQFLELKAAKKEEDLNGNSSNLIENSNLESLWTQLENAMTEGKDFPENYHVNKVHFSSDIFDENGGPDYVEITEKTLKKVYGEDVSELDYSAVTKIPVSCEPENGHYYFEFEYDFSDDLPDGLVQLTVVPVDLSGRKGIPYNFAVVRDTTIDFSFEPRNEFVKYYYGINKIEDYIEDRKIIGFDNSNNHIMDLWFTDIKGSLRSSYEELGLKLELLDESGNVIESKTKDDVLDFDGFAESKGWVKGQNRSFNDDFDCVFYFEKLNGDKEQTLRLYLTDTANNTVYKDYTLYKAPEILYVECVQYTEDEQTFYKYNVNFQYSKGLEVNGYDEIGFYYYTDDDITDIKIKGITIAGMEADSYVDKMAYFSIDGVTDLDKKYYCYVTFVDGLLSGFSKQYEIQNGQVNGSGGYSASDVLLSTNYTTSFMPVRKLNSNEYELKIHIPTFSTFGSGYYVISIYENGVLKKLYNNPITGIDSSFIMNVENIDCSCSIEYYICLYCNNTLYKSGIINAGISSELNKDFSSPLLELSGKSYDSNYLDKYYSSYKISLKDYPLGNYVNLLDSNGKIPVYVSVFEGTRSEKINDAEILKRKEYRTVYLTPNASNEYIIPLPELYKYDNETLFANDENCTVWIYVEDINGNYSSFVKYPNFITKDTYAIKKAADSLKFTGEKPNYCHWEKWDSVSKKWIDKTKEQYGEIKEEGVSLNYANNSSYNGLEEDKDFVRLWRTNTYVSVMKYYWYSKKAQCHKKDYSLGKQLSVEHDKPVFVHTIYSTENFGADPDLWERYAGNECKINGELIDPSVTGSESNFYYMDTSTIPTGSYYTVVIHYADGDSKCLPVMQK